MDALAATAISVVAPYIAKGAESFADEAGRQIVGGVEALYQRLRQWWSGEPIAGAVAAELPKDPVQGGKVLSSMLAEKLKADPVFAGEVQRLVDEIGPQLKVVQRIEVTEGVTGADIGTLARGDVLVEQQIGKATDVVGAKVDRIG